MRSLRSLGLIAEAIEAWVLQLRCKGDVAKLLGNESDFTIFIFPTYKRYRYSFCWITHESHLVFYYFMVFFWPKFHGFLLHWLAGFCMIFFSSWESKTFQIYFFCGEITCLFKAYLPGNWVLRSRSSLLALRLAILVSFEDPFPCNPFYWVFCNLFNVLSSFPFTVRSLPLIHGPSISFISLLA